MARQNYFNTLTMAQKLDQLGRCRFMDRSEFNGVEKLRGKKVVIVGCGAQGLNQGLNMRDSGLDISYALRADAIEQKRVSYTNATSNGFKVGTPKPRLYSSRTSVPGHLGAIITTVRSLRICCPSSTMLKPWL